ncbi:MAG TPA: pectate lyase [Pyrinomonadaceae bacterium]|nr:pectate lyase [Acidobacteriota bacterium]HQZ94971.1 pectate lyase [Pyrinomonadaceae bacterium]
MKKAVFVNLLLFVVLAAQAAFGQKPDLTVAADGTGNFKTVQEAINKVPENNAKRFVIAIKSGTYQEQIRVPANKPYVSFIGTDAAKTILSFKISNKDAGSTSAAYATYIGGHDFYAENITFENSFGKPSPAGGQAVALLVEADRAVFKKCRFLGWQDTLYAKNGRQYYTDSYIEGTVDFIFGQAAAVFENCEIRSKGDGYLTAPMRFAATEPAGFVFNKCRLTAENTEKGVFLGRPWRDYGRTVFLNTEMGEHIKPEGWHHWQPEREKTAYFAEYKSTGKGANDAARVKWSHQLTDAEATAFSAENFLKGKDGWNPKTANDSWLEKTKPDWRLVQWGGDILKMPALWYQTDEAARIGDQLLVYQKDNGGWEKNSDHAAMLTQAEKNALLAKRADISETTIDNRTSYTQVAYLGKLITASLLKTSPPTNFPKYKESFNKGLDYLLSSQYENGGFPQFFPLKRGYYTHITFNDDAMIGVLTVLRDIGNAKDDYKFVDEGRRAKAAAAAAKALPLILKLQVEIGGKKTVWVQQYDEVTLKPAWARKFEPPCLTSSESVGIVRYLMAEKQTPEITAAIEAAIKWFESTKLTGIKWERVNGNNVVVPDKAAKPIWARFYEFETMKPIFIGRDSVIKYDVAQIEAERRNGYAWYIENPRNLIEIEYPKWKAKQAK